MRDDRLLLGDMLEAIAQVERYAANGRDAFFREELVQVWVLHHIQIIGEAAGRLSRDLRDRYPEVPWPDIVAMRNVLVHHYFGIDWVQIWDTAERDLPELKRTIRGALADLDGGSQ